MKPNLLEVILREYIREQVVYRLERANSILPSQARDQIRREIIDTVNNICREMIAERLLKK